ncbi:cholinesterase [Acanthamoeba castellanii str. Neff]|uniref:Carboxylic ester hydrolase n=1 Tax=Acanthamoeba castellanii (strain ATCC 30010 / Neff) TaxID=1257118 RepID=L8H8H3_ACACF|nr:cholinesterase [Acanthamoeba castellanii str. Neff]ELR21527.1 cholinesterase [Acanthamoeba castellanii str. Neff]
MKGATWVTVLVVLGLVAAAQADESIVYTQAGPLRGVGVPFAEPPVGPLRFTPPLPKRPWGNSPYNATAYGAGCPQQCVLPPHLCPETQSEDCLFLNIWTPRVKTGQAPLPVMFFMPGGRFEQGEAASLVYSGEYMASSADVILVTTNYRLGVLGFLVADGIPGNFGIKDQRLALEWVIKNIAAFGGNPKNITIFGESAGATSVAVHLVSQYSQGLYSKAIIESNPFSLPIKTIPEAKALAKLFVDKIQCPWGQDTLSCLRGKNWHDIVGAGAAVENSSIGDELLGQPWNLILSGKFNRVPLLLGTVSEEAWPFIFQASSKPLSESLYVLFNAYLFNIDMVSVLRRYPVGGVWDYSDYRPLLAELGTDYIFTCLTRGVARKISSLGSFVYRASVYLYQFNHSTSFDPWGSKYKFFCHGIELPFVFHSVKPFFNFSAGEADLSRRMVSYWTNFAKSGNPNAPVAVQPSWPLYSQAADQSMELAVPPTVKTGLRAAYCDFWDNLGYSFGN